MCSQHPKYKKAYFLSEKMMTIGKQFSMKGPSSTSKTVARRTTFDSNWLEVEFKMQTWLSGVDWKNWQIKYVLNIGYATNL
jgi:hypothetical protein